MPTSWLVGADWPIPEPIMTALNRVYSWRLFSPVHRAWTEVRRSYMHGPDAWYTEARTQDGRLLASRVIDSAYADDLFQRYGADAEITYFS